MFSAMASLVISTAVLASPLSTASKSFLEISHELPLDFLGSRHFRPLNSRTASNIATRFSVGLPAWML